jgi:hypothetical protein
MTRNDFKVHDVVKLTHDSGRVIVGSVVAVWPEGITVEWDDGKIGLLGFDWQLEGLEKVG